MPSIMNSKDGTASRGAGVMRRVNSIGLLLLAVLILAGCQEKPETAESVVQKVIGAHGGAKAMRDAGGLLFHGQINALVEQEQAKIWILFRKPLQLRVALESEKFKEDRLFLDGQGWQNNGSGFFAVSGSALAVMQFQAEHLSLPFRLLERQYEVVMPNEVVADQPVVLMLKDAEGIETKVSVDPVKWFVRAVERDFEIRGAMTRFSVVYEDYRTVKGLQLPFRISNYINGQAVGRTDFVSVQTNPSLPEKIFSAPGK